MINVIEWPRAKKRFDPVATASTVVTLPALEQVTPQGLDMLPQIFRLTSIRFEDNGARSKRCTATLYHRQAQLRVEWNVAYPDLRLKPNQLVSPRWSPKPHCQQGAMRVSRLVLMERPEPWLNLYDTVPDGWVDDRQLLEKAAGLIEQLPRPYRHLYNAIFWDGERFRRFCRAPSSMNGHHAEDGGNLRHAVDVAGTMAEMSRLRSSVDPHLAILVGLLHDAGKADEYRLQKNGNWGMTDRGKLLGHKITVVEWIASAMARWHLRIPEAHYMALLHCLTCSSHAPEYLGIRRPALMEAFLLSDSDRSSGLDDLFNRCSGGDSPWGSYHGHLRNRPYQLPKDVTEITG